MGRRRRNVFILLFVLGLIAISAVVIAKKETKLGLDLKGGVQLVLQGRPTPQQPTVDSSSMERAVEPEHLAGRHPRIDPAAALEHQPDSRPVVP